MRLIRGLTRPEQVFQVRSSHPHHHERKEDMHLFARVVYINLQFPMPRSNLRMALRVMHFNKISIRESFQLFGERSQCRKKS